MYAERIDVSPNRTVSTTNGRDKRQGLGSYIRKYNAFYVMLIPGLLYFFVFKYLPLIGSVIAFQDYNFMLGLEGFWKSPWVGLKHFEAIFEYPHLRNIVWNTIILSIYQIVFSFPAPIILALLLNEIRMMAAKRVLQTIVYLPHFFSWTVVFGFSFMLLSSRGLVNELIGSLGGEPIMFLQSVDHFRSIMVISGMWKEMGWSAIIYLAAIAGISPSLYEAAKMDGAGRWKQFVHITMPGLLPTVMILLLLRVGNVLEIGFEQVFVFQNPANLPVSEILDTYAYRTGIQTGLYSVTAAIGLFKSLVGMTLLLFANRISKSTTGESIY
ncbi:ABC transporter permease [Paenibacillus roseipurpureus]|uniref:ABC transporter permease subunit n=1 Tax=Paenibacillus roseopurpureus TaxID=2918901 RepID=A0AA96LR58_9BACL|nr:ABC transporter permease subunit [Paenibacillus sp. MBLB1832]WNR45766.1 ABC transporter permease subunit [Paenibacillus sp. MBLB1832]